MDNFFPKENEDLTIQVDFYKTTGKWKYGGLVNVGEARMYKGDIPQAIVDNQEIIFDGWQEHEEFIVVINDTAENWENPEYRAFNKAVILPSRFKGLKRK